MGKSATYEFGGVKFEIVDIGSDYILDIGAKPVADARHDRFVERAAHLAVVAREDGYHVLAIGEAKKQSQKNRGCLSHYRGTVFLV